MGVDDELMPVLGIYHIVSTIVEFMCVCLRYGSINYDYVMMYSYTPVEQYFLVRH